MPATPWARAASRRARAGGTPRTSSRREPRELPRVAFARVAHSVVQAAAASLPEFHVIRQHAIATPMRRTLGCVAVLGGKLAPARFEPLPALDHVALRRGPGADARADGTRVVVGA